MLIASKKWTKSLSSFFCGIILKTFKIVLKFCCPSQIYCLIIKLESVGHANRYNRFFSEHLLTRLLFIATTTTMYYSKTYPYKHIIWLWWIWWICSACSNNICVPILVGINNIKISKKLFLSEAAALSTAFPYSLVHVKLWKPFNRYKEKM